MGTKRKLFDIDNAIKEYRSGMSEFQIAKHLGIDRGTLRARFLSRNIHIRSIQEANALRMSKLTATQKKTMTKNANDACRGREHSMEEKLQRAKTFQKTMSKIGRGEKEMTFWLKERGLNVIPQQAVHSYNIDIGTFPVAVEIYLNWCNPILRKREREKIEYLSKHGWAVLYIHLPPNGEVTRFHADYVAAFFQSVCRDKSLLGEYRVIGRDCKLKAVRRFD